MSDNTYKLELLKNIANIQISNVDKNIIDNEINIKLCNYTDVYNSWAITKYKSKFFMHATATKTEIEKFILKKGMVALTKDSEQRDDIGISTYIADDFNDIILGYHNALIKPMHNKLNGSFLNAYLHTSFVKKYFSYNASGSGQRYTLSPNRISKLKIYLPDIKLQNSIGKLFSSIDKKIEINNQINSELEQMAKTLYNYWFIQFDFPDENGRPYKSSGGKMVWNEELKKEIPEGWEVDNLTKYCTLYNGYAFPSNIYLDKGKFKIYTIKNVTDNGINPSNCSYINEIPKKMNKECFLTPGNILLTLTGHIGRVGIVYETNALLNQRVLKIVSEYPLLTYLILNDKYIYNQIKNNANGSSQKNLSPNALNEILYAYPNKYIISDFIQKYGMIYDKIISLQQNIKELTSLRDFLLPLLMNGQAVIRE